MFGVLVSGCPFRQPTQSLRSSIAINSTFGLSAAPATPATHNTNNSNKLFFITISFTTSYSMIFIEHPVKRAALEAEQTACGVWSLERFQIRHQVADLAGRQD